MSPPIATFIYALGIVGLFWLDRNPGMRRSWALLLPGLWLSISCSRHVSEWLGVAPAQSQQQYLDGSPLDAAVYALLLCPSVIVLCRRGKAVTSLLHKNWPILLFVFYCASSIAWSDHPGVAFKRWIKSLGDYAIVLILLTDPQPLKAVQRVLTRVGFILLPLSVLFIKYYPTLGRAYAQHWEGTQFFLGVADNKNMLGTISMIFGFAAYWRVLEAVRAPWRRQARTLVAHGALGAIAMWLLILCNSITSLSCLVLTAALITAHAFLKTARGAVLNVLLIIIVLGSFCVLFLGVESNLLQALGRTSSLTGRTDIWDILLGVSINPVVGTGFESFWLGNRLDYLWSFQTLKGINEAHNGYLEVYLNLGVLGLILVGLLMWSGYKNILRLLEREPDIGRLKLGYFLIAVIYNFTEAGIRTTDPVWLGLLLSVIMLPQQRLAPAVVSDVSPRYFHCRNCWAGSQTDWT